MILYSKERKAIAAPGVLSVDLNDDEGYLYISTSLFAQLLTLKNKFGTVENMLESVKFELSQGDVVSHVNDLLPDPYCFLSPFINLIDRGEVPLSKMDLETTFGVLGLVAKEISFLDYARGKLSPHLRFATDLLVNYELSCKDVECTFGLVEIEDDVTDYTMSDDSGTVWNVNSDDPVVVETKEYMEKIDGLVKHYSKYLKRDNTVNPIKKWDDDAEYEQLDEKTELLDDSEPSDVAFIDKEMNRMKIEFSKDSESEETTLL